MFDVQITVDKNSLEWIRKLPNMTKKTLRRVVVKSTDVAYDEAKRKLAGRVFEGDLLNSLRKRVYYYKGYVGIEGSANIINEAILNEYGPTQGYLNEPVIMSKRGLVTPYFLASPKLQRWMDRSGYKTVQLGGAGTNWGNRNRFLIPGMQKMLMMLPRILDEELWRIK